MLDDREPSASEPSGFFGAGDDQIGVHRFDHPERLGDIDRRCNREPAFTEDGRRFSFRIGAMPDDEDERSGAGLILWPAASAWGLPPVRLCAPF